MDIFDIPYIFSVVLDIFKVVPESLALSLFGFILAIVISLIVNIVDYYRIPILHPISRFYVSFFRGTPLLPQLFLIYFGLPAISSVFISISSFWAVVIALGLNSGAYMSETLRGSILSVDKFQMEAGQSIGLKEYEVMKLIILPQAIRYAIPALMNNLVDIIKSSSLAFTVGLIDITAVAKMRAASNYNYFDSYIAAMLVYWAIVLITERLQVKVEAKLNVY